MGEHATTHWYAMAIKTVLFAFDLLVAVMLFRISKELYSERKAYWSNLIDMYDV